MKNRKISTFIFQVGYTISMFLDILIFRKLHIQLDHSYTRKNMYLVKNTMKLNQELFI